MSTTKRNEGLDVLRCLAMMMVVVLHFLGKGNILPSAVATKTMLFNDGAGVTGTGSFGGIGGTAINGGVLAVWLLEALCIVAVNAYMLISGYFLCESGFKLRRLISLYVQLWLYSVLIGSLGIGLSMAGFIEIEAIDFHYLLLLLFPISMEHYWFLTAYIYFFLLLPLLGRGLKSLSQKQHLCILLLLLFNFCILKSILPVRFDFDKKGYDAIWYSCVFVAAAYIRRYKPAFFEKKKNCRILYLCGVLGIVAELALLWVVFMKKGALSYIMNISLEYNHLFVFLASLGLVCYFINSNPPAFIGKLASKLGPYTLGVYLLHENISLRYCWQDLFGSGDLVTRLESIFNQGAVFSGEVMGFFLLLVLRTILAAVVVFSMGILVDFLRKGLQDILHKGLGNLSWYQKLDEKVLELDQGFVTVQNQGNFQ